MAIKKRLRSDLSKPEAPVEPIDHIEATTLVPKRFYLTIDPVFFSIFIITFLTRYYNIEYPRAVVFDELHYIKFISLYLKRIFFFDPQPPLAKQLMTIFAHAVGFQGDLSYVQIGDIYKPELPVKSLRLLPCLCGSLIAPISYSISLELGYRQTTAVIVSLLVIIENSLLTQSRYLLLDSILVLFITLSIYSYVKFSQKNSSIWLTLAAIFSTLAACTKYSGFYSYILILGLITRSWWSQLSGWNVKKFALKTTQYLIIALILPVIIYVGVYYAHLNWLTRAGPHDSIMTSAFQASLENGLASITRGQPLEIVHGSQITLRHTHGRSCWVHSHEHLYPIKYPDGRGSSHQQQVTCYSFKDVNNWWIVKRPHIDELVVTEPYDKIKDGDLIQLVHGITGRALNSHDVASPMSQYRQEVSCYVDHNISSPAQDVWRVRLQNPSDTQYNWHTINSRLQLIHLNSSLALRFSGHQLPEWGFHQHEIVADKDLKNDDTVWNVEEHRHTKTEDQQEREYQLGQAEFVPLEPTSLTFLEKFYELHYKLLSYNRDAMRDHLYACESPIDWLAMSRGTAYWVSKSINDHGQIFLIGNTATSLSGICCIVAFGLAMIVHLLRRRRRVFHDFNDVIWSKMSRSVFVLIGGYLTHLLPYFAYETPLFLQFYLPAIIFKILLIGAFIEYLHDLRVQKYIVNGLSLLIVARSFDVFIKLLPLSTGTNLTRQELESLKWKETWQLITLNA